MDTIVAISTPVGRGGIAVIRLSGNPLPIALQLFSTAEIENIADIRPRYMYLGTIRARGFEDKGYMVYFKSPKSYTGEDVVEFHIHGGVKLAEGVVGECASLGARPAERGEFTKRAFLNGKMALSDAEGVIDMINADSEEAVRAAYRVMTGRLSGAVKLLQSRLTDIMSGLEAVLDYPDELEDETLPEAKSELLKIREELLTLEKQRAYGKLVKNGIGVVIAGDPNVGKSSLMNAMLGADRAIVSDISGTTRDYVGESLEYKGKKINLTDTAGIRQTDDNIEKDGVNRSVSIIKQADLVIKVYDAANRSLLNSALENALKDKKVIEVFNKTDLLKDAPTGGGDKFYVSAKTGAGIEKLLDKIVEIFEADKTPEGEILTSERHLFAVKTASDKIGEAIGSFDETTSDCIIAVLTEAWRALGEITGETVTEKIIDNIFDKFCVGK